eukprot:NODE_1398_length_1431_cov_129.399421_g1163_i0.p2 GENE.NODE_1398_length_1431_cov_129.399421_g1163_i0~~NODE_1398_length_1431_cov_129.399421_g1163_i0.p2  ORF type:complete len:395 (+),score=149.56 NODE_1398_length_1431_cov_129.399421_g1163_i0:125-1309(+)
MPPKKSRPTQYMPEEEEDIDAGSDNEIPAELRDRVAKMLNPAKYAAAFEAALPEGVQKRVVGLKAIQKDVNKLRKEFLDEQMALEKKFSELYAPLYSSRREIVNGDREPTEDEVTSGKTYFEESVKEEEPEKKEGEEETPTPKKDPMADARKQIAEEDAKFVAGPDASAATGVPCFWLLALQNQEDTCEMIQAKDREALKSLIDVTSETLTGEERGFRLDFHFASNNFFAENLLTKTYTYTNDDDQIVLKQVKGCKISWNDGKNLTVDQVTKKQKKGKGKNAATRTVVVEEPCESFFNFFSPTEITGEEQDEEDESMIEQDFELGQSIRSKLIPRAVGWFTGAAMPAGHIQLPPWEDDDEEGEEEDEDEAPRAAIQGHKKAGGAGGQNPECKQQ